MVVVICNEILMIVGSDYGTKLYIWLTAFSYNMLYLINKIVTSTDEVMQISVKRQKL